MHKHYRHSSARITPAIITVNYFTYQKSYPCTLPNMAYSMESEGNKISYRRLPGNQADDFNADTDRSTKSANR